MAKGGQDMSQAQASNLPIPRAPTLVEGAIWRPDEPRHFMVIEPVEGTVTARVGDTVVASSAHAVRVKEVGLHIYEPVIYFPPQDVRGELLVPVARTTRCPLKGTASYYDIEVQDHVSAGAWSYQQTLGFDRRLTQLESCVAFDRSHVDIEISE